MGDPLTVREVERYARRALAALYTVPLSSNVSPATRTAIAKAVGALDELLLLVELVDCIAEGIVVAADREFGAPA